MILGLDGGGLREIAQTTPIAPGLEIILCSRSQNRRQRAGEPMTSVAFLRRSRSRVY